MTKFDAEKMPQRIGNYVAVKTAVDVDRPWFVRHAWTADVLSRHATKADAVAAAKRYHAGDKRRGLA